MDSVFHLLNNSGLASLPILCGEINHSCFRFNSFENAIVLLLLMLGKVPFCAKVMCKVPRGFFGVVLTTVWSRAEVSMMPTTSISFFFSAASRRNTISRETSTAVAKKRTGPSLKRGAYKQREETKKRARFSIDEEISDDGQVKDRFAGSVGREIKTQVQTGVQISLPSSRGRGGSNLLLQLPV